MRSDRPSAASPGPNRRATGSDLPARAVVEADVNLTAGAARDLADEVTRRGHRTQAARNDKTSIGGRSSGRHQGGQESTQAKARVSTETDSQSGPVGIGSSAAMPSGSSLSNSTHQCAGRRRGRAVLAAVELGRQTDDQHRATPTLLHQLALALPGRVARIRIRAEQEPHLQPLEGRCQEIPESRRGPRRGRKDLRHRSRSVLVGPAEPGSRPAAPPAPASWRTATGTRAGSAPARCSRGAGSAARGVSRPARALADRAGRPAGLPSYGSAGRSRATSTRDSSCPPQNRGTTGTRA